jgi:hypothetical protein
MCLKSEEYHKFYASVGGHVILDNGAAEGDELAPDALQSLAEDIGANEVVAPDVIGNMEQTLMQLRDFMRTANGRNVMAVLQCYTWAGFDYIFKTAVHLQCASVALPRVMCSALGPLARLTAAELIHRESRIPIHALGSTMRMHEAQELADQGIVRGIDTSAPVALGLAGYSLRSGYMTRQADYFYLEPNIEARMNLDTFHSWCRGKEA